MNFSEHFLPFLEIDNDKQKTASVLSWKSTSLNFLKGVFLTCSLSIKSCHWPLCCRPALLMVRTGDLFFKDSETAAAIVSANDF